MNSTIPKIKFVTKPLALNTRMFVDTAPSSRLRGKYEKGRDSLLLRLTRQKSDSCPCGSSAEEGTGCADRLGERWTW
jgi:hypothetical protein